MARIASFHLIRERPGRAVFAVARLGLDRPRLERTPGLRFWRLLGTGSGSTTGPGADFRRTALLAVWDDEADLDRFLVDSAIADRWTAAAESWHVRLRAIGGHGTWQGIDPLDGLEPGDGSGPVAIVTRASVRRRAWASFRRASREVDAELQSAAGLIEVVAIGEAPLGRLGTFSLWESQAAAQAFASSQPRHQEVIERTRADGWYRDEWFARFEPYSSGGSWNGRDPLMRYGTS